MSTHVLAEAALRSLIMGAIILAALHLLRVHQLRAQRTAWLIALGGALVMPALVSLQIGPRLLPQIAAATLMQPDAVRGTDSVAAAVLPARASHGAQSSHTVPLEIGQSSPAARYSLAAWVSRAAIAVYFTVAALLLIRLGCGAVLALRLRHQAPRTTLHFAPRTDIRVSSRIATPVTVASTVLLPLAYSSWDAPTLQVVLTHECAHVRQRDFYVHLVAGLHCALFWFNVARSPDSCSWRS